MNGEAIIESLQAQLDEARYSVCLSFVGTGTALIIVPTSTDRFDMAKALYANDIRLVRMMAMTTPRSTAYARVRNIGIISKQIDTPSRSVTDH